MGDMADYYIENQIERHMNPPHTMHSHGLKFPAFVTILSKNYWIAADGRKLDPEKDMDASHIENVMEILKGEKFIRVHQKASVLSYLVMRRPNGDMAQDAFYQELDRASEDSELSVEDYFHERVERSTLWECLARGLAKHNDQLQKTKKLNDGVIEW